MPGARETVQRLKEEGVFVAIVSAGVDLFVSSIASMLDVDDWIANGFVFDDDGYLTDEGVCRLHASGKGEIITRLLEMNGYKPCLLYTSPSPRDQRGSRMPSSA